MLCKSCGPGTATVFGRIYEGAREYTPYKGPHDSYKQDVKNQAVGVRIGKSSKPCKEGCTQAFNAGALDVSAPATDRWWNIQEDRRVSNPLPY